MAKIAVGSAVEAYFVKLGAMLLRHRSENGITTSALFRRGRRGGKSDGGLRIKRWGSSINFVNAAGLRPQNRAFVGLCHFPSFDRNHAGKERTHMSFGFF